MDLQGVEYQDPVSGRRYYVLKGLGLRAWQIDDARWETIERDLQESNPPPLDRPVDDLLMEIDPQTKAYRPEKQATFLFLTRDGACGVLRLMGQVTRIVGENDPPVLAEEAGERGFFRGVRFEAKLLYLNDAVPAGDGSP